MHLRSSTVEALTPFHAGLLAAFAAAAAYIMAITVSRTLSAETAVVVKALIVAPVVEELLFRSVVQARLHALRVFRQRPWTVIVLTAIAFGAAHLVSAPPLHAALVTAPAIAIGWAFERTRSVGFCVALHSAANAIWIGFWSL